MKRLVIGCGYVGWPTALDWLRQGDDVFALTRSAPTANRMSKVGLTPLLGDITDIDSLPDFPSVDTVLFAVGMDRSKYQDVRSVYVEGLANTLQRIADCKRFVYLSTTGVFGNVTDETVTENSPTSPTRDGAIASLEAEQLLLQHPVAKSLVRLRLAGIYGPDRIPSLKFLRAGQLEKLRPEGFLNLIHLSDIQQSIHLASNHETPSDFIFGQ